MQVKLKVIEEHENRKIVIENHIENSIDIRKQFIVLITNQFMIVRKMLYQQIK